MSEHKDVYKWSKRDAIHAGELENWRESYKENCYCARTIEKVINENYQDNCLKECAKQVIEEFGFNRVNWVLSNTVQRNKADGRISEENKMWAKERYIPNDEENWHFEVKSHPGLLDLFVKDARKAWSELGLYDKTHCSDEENYEGRVLILRPSIFKDEFKKPEFQLFYANCGNGCNPDATGTKVFGFFIADGEETNYRRGDFIGAIREELIPDWAKAKLNEYLSQVDSPEVSMEGM